MSHPGAQMYVFLVSSLRSTLLSAAVDGVFGRNTMNLDAIRRCISTGLRYSQDDELNCIEVLVEMLHLDDCVADEHCFGIKPP